MDKNLMPSSSQTERDRHTDCKSRFIKVYSASERRQSDLIFDDPEVDLEVTES